MLIVDRIETNEQNTFENFVEFNMK